MNKNLDYLESLTPGIKFIKDKELRLANLAIQATAISNVFLQKRERLDSDEFTEAGLKRQRVLSDAILPECKIVIEGHYEKFRRRRSSVLMMKDIMDEIEVDEDKKEAVDEENKSQPKIDNKKAKDHDGFDFGVPKNRRKKEAKFVIRVDKNNEELKLNDKSKTRRKKGSEEVDKQSLDSFIKVEEGFDEDAEDKQSGLMDEQQRMKAKISKVSTYWEKNSLYIPNVFRLARLIEDDPKCLLEYQDYSKKSVLVQGNSQTQKKSIASRASEKLKENEIDEDDVKFIHRRSFNIVLDHPEDMLVFLK